MCFDTVTSDMKVNVNSMGACLARCHLLACETNANDLERHNRSSKQLGQSLESSKIDYANVWGGNPLDLGAWTQRNAVPLPL